ncbi:hypothetical protein Baya_15271 [Bagarius yarrelli]|uniref:Uncharacterized protein n=1 Tax=Bagarius yarrelli TaxID=175774 RepID=A0A556VXN0_BAGYA|nr:hypothetical protein Baya_15271 [Bagarius yarrelli]
MFVWSEEGYCAPGRMVASDMRLGKAIYAQLDYFTFKFTRHLSDREMKLHPDVSPSSRAATEASRPNHSHCNSHNALMIKTFAARRQTVRAM